MSVLKIPPHAAEHEDGDGRWAFLLARLLDHVSTCLSSLAVRLSPACPAHPHASALPPLLDRLLLVLPPQQHHHHDNQELKPQVEYIVFPSSLLQLDILGALLLVVHNLRVLLLTLAQSYSGEAHEDSTVVIGAREEVGLLKERDVYVRESHGCLERLLAIFRRKSFRSLQKETMNGIEIDGKELSKRFMETVSDLEKYSDHLGLSFRKLKMQLSSTVTLMTTRLTCGQHLTMFSTIAHMRMVMRSFLYDKEESPLDLENADSTSHHGDQWLTRQAEMLIQHLLNPQGPQLVGLGGGKGLGKTCLASHVACDKRVSASFPGGIVYLSLGYEPDLTSLQAQLWKQMGASSICCYTSKASFSTPEEGTAALMSRAQDCLPCLLVLDDVCHSAHVEPFLFFDTKEKGRVLVISRAVERVLAKWVGDTFVHVLEPLDEREATCLFNTIAGGQDSEAADTMAALTKHCAGTPRLIEALASIVYYEKVRACSLSSVLNRLKQGTSRARLLISKMLISGVVGEGEKSPEGLGEGQEALEQQGPSTVSSRFDSTGINLILYFDALAEVHPYLQECFLDLAAFPKGEWVSLSTLVDIWSAGNRMEKERVLFVLCFLASRSMIEWKVEDSLVFELDEVFSLHWRLADVFYELAQSLIQTWLKDMSKSSAVDNKEVKVRFTKESLKGCACDVNGILDSLQSAIKAFDVCTCSHFKQNSFSACGVQEHKNKEPDDVLLRIKSDSRRGLFFSTCASIQENCRMFFPGWRWDQDPAWWNKGRVLKATKLSLASANMIEFPAEVDFPNLKVAVLSNIKKLNSIPQSALTYMEQLVVLDLKHSSSLTILPHSISSLQCLEVLDLSLCTQLLSVPQAVGKLRNLKYLRLSGCLSLTCLPISVGSLTNLIMLDLSLCSRMRSLPRTVGNLLCLQNLNLSGCYSLQCLPATMASLRKLRTLVISGCSNLSYTPPWFEQLMNLARGRAGGAIAVPLQLWKLDQIEILHLGSLKNLTYVPQAVGKLQHLRHLSLSSCRSLDYLPDDVGLLFLLEKLDLSHTAIRKLPPTIGQLSNLVNLCLRGCSRLLCLPPSISGLPKLECLQMAECWDFVMLPPEFGKPHSMPKLIELDLSGCSLKNLPCFAEGALPMLQRLHLSSCQNLSFLPTTLGVLTSLERLDLGGCKSLASLQGIGFADLKQLQWINLRNCLLIMNLPVLELLGLQSLKFLDVSGCTKLSPFPEPLLQCAREHRFTLIRWGTVWH